MEENGVKQADIVVALYNLTKAVYEICNHLDVDSATLGTDYLADIGTPFLAAMAGLIGAAPHTARNTIVAT
jgi:hypothetical protein